MSNADSGMKDSAAFFGEAVSDLLSGMGTFSAENFAAHVLDKLIAEGYLELKPGCTREQTAGFLAAAFRTLTLKMPPGL